MNQPRKFPKLYYLSFYEVRHPYSMCSRTTNSNIQVDELSIYEVLPLSFRNDKT